MLSVSREQILNQIKDDKVFKSLMNMATFFKSNGSKIFEDLIDINTIEGRYSLMHEWLDNCRYVFPMMGIKFVYRNPYTGRKTRHITSVDIFRYNQHIITIEAPSKFEGEVRAYERGINLIEEERASIIIKGVLSKYIESYEAVNKPIKIEVDTGKYFDKTSFLLYRNIGIKKHIFEKTKQTTFYEFLDDIRTDGRTLKRKKLIELLEKNEQTTTT